MAQAKTDPHTRDLGYLERFIAKLRSEAAARPAGAERERLLALLDEESARWVEIHALLGAPPSGPAASASMPAPKAPQAPQSRPARPGAPAAPPPPFLRAPPPPPREPTQTGPKTTIGSLRGDRRGGF